MSEQVYRAPIDGVYMVAAEVIRFEPTGESHMVPNPARSWYTFWRPALVKRPIMKRIVDYSGRAMIKAKAGDILHPPFMRVSQ